MLEKFEVHDELNPKLWTKDNRLLTDVEEKLFEIVKKFKEDISLPIDVVDAHLVGSNASYNYTENSDLDLHLIANFDTIGVSKEILQSAYNLEKASFNKKYAIKIHGVDIEVYIEDIRSSAVTNGIYSLFDRKWIKFPKKIVVNNDIDVSDEVSRWKDEIDNACSKYGDESKELLNRIYMVRKNSLAIDGEYGKGNQLFKQLRNDGYLDILRDCIVRNDNKRLSLEGINESLLMEDSRNALLAKSKASLKGRQRFNRRTRSKVANSVKQFNSIDMNKLFKDNILTVNVSVNGETNDYTVRISFGGFLEILHDELKKTNNVLELKCIVRALITGFNKSDVFIGCDCPDFRYRFGYWTTRNGVSSIDPENRPSNITNPNDTLGSGCKHTLLVLSNNSWIIKCASVINNYIKYMSKNYKKLYADVIYPAIYQKPFEEPVQLSIFDKDTDELDTDTQTLDKANKLDDRDDKGRFTVGNKQGVKFAPKPTPNENPNQTSLFDDEM